MVFSTKKDFACETICKHYVGCESDGDKPKYFRYMSGAHGEKYDYCCSEMANRVVCNGDARWCDSGYHLYKSGAHGDEMDFCCPKNPEEVRDGRGYSWCNPQVHGKAKAAYKNHCPCHKLEEGTCNATKGCEWVDGACDTSYFHCAGEFKELEPHHIEDMKEVTNCIHECEGCRDSDKYWDGHNCLSERPKNCNVATGNFWGGLAGLGGVLLSPLGGDGCNVERIKAGWG